MHNYGVHSPSDPESGFLVGSKTVWCISFALCNVFRSLHKHLLFHVLLSDRQELLMYRQRNLWAAYCGARVIVNQQRLSQCWTQKLCLQTDVALNLAIWKEMRWKIALDDPHKIVARLCRQTQKQQPYMLLLTSVVDCTHILTWSTCCINVYTCIKTNSDIYLNEKITTQSVRNTCWYAAPRSPHTQLFQNCPTGKESCQLNCLNNVCLPNPVCAWLCVGSSVTAVNLNIDRKEKKWCQHLLYLFVSVVSGLKSKLRQTLMKFFHKWPAYNHPHSPACLGDSAIWLASQWPWCHLLLVCWCPACPWGEDALCRCAEAARGPPVERFEDAWAILQV